MGMGRRLDRRNHGRCAVLDAPDSRRRFRVRLAACADFGVDMVARGLLVAAVAVIGLAQTGDKRIERPRMSVDGYAQVAALGALAAADYHSTQRAFANVPSGREANPLLSCGGQLCGQRYWALNVGLIGANYAINRFVAPRLSPRGRRALSVIQWSAIGWRGYAVAHNYRSGSR